MTPPVDALTVMPGALTSIAVTPANPLDRQRPDASSSRLRGRISDGSMADVTGSVTWSSSNTAAATIGATGLATGVGVGTSEYTATLSGVTAGTMC